MSFLRNSALIAALTLAPALAAPGQAMTASSLSGLATPTTSEASRAGFVFADALVPGRPSRLDGVDAEAAGQAAEEYFNFDAVVSLGALVVAGGLLAAFGAAASRRDSGVRADEHDEEWRDSVFRAVQADLAEFTKNYRRAARSGGGGRRRRIGRRGTSRVVER